MCGGEFTRTLRFWWYRIDLQITVNILQAVPYNSDVGWRQVHATLRCRVSYKWIVQCSPWSRFRKHVWKLSLLISPWSMLWATATNPPRLWPRLTAMDRTETWICCIWYRTFFFFGNFPLVLSQLACRINLIYSYILLSRVIATSTQEAASLMMLAKISTTALWWINTLPWTCKSLAIPYVPQAVIPSSKPDFVIQGRRGRVHGIGGAAGPTAYGS